MIEVIGWFSSVVLVLTIGKQVYKQWQAGTSEGVSKWLFVGQVTASATSICWARSLAWAGTTKLRKALLPSRQTAAWYR